MAQGKIEIERNCAASNIHIKSSVNPFFDPLGAKKAKQNKKNNENIVLVNQDFVGNMVALNSMCMYIVREIR